MSSYLLLVAAGVLAGTMNAVAGGGSFVGFPAMVAAGLPAIVANASNTVALVPGSLSSAFVYRKSLAGFGGVSVPILLALSAAGGLAGALLLLLTPGHIFDGMVPWLLLLASLTFSLGHRAGAVLRRHVTIGRRTLMVVQFILGIYGGYFGGAVGIMLMATWTLLDNIDFKALAAIRTLLVTVMNAMAVIAFVVAGAVAWPQTLAMMAGGIVGGTLGARVARLLPARVIRITAIVLTWVITLLFFWRRFGH